MPDLPKSPTTRRYYRDYLRRGGHLILDLTPETAKRAAGEFEGARGLLYDPPPAEAEPLGAVIELAPALGPRQYEVKVYRQEITHEGHVAARAYVLHAAADGPGEVHLLILGRSAKGPADPLDFTYLD